MKKFVIIAFSIILLISGLYIGIQYQGWYIDLHFDDNISVVASVHGDKIYLSSDMDNDFIFKGVNMGTGIPGEWSTSYTITKDRYMKWFEQIKKMGANTLRIYAILNPEFYQALYEYNTGRDDPLYLMQGVWVNDEVQNSHADAFNKKFQGQFQKDCLMAVDVIHGSRGIFTSNTSHSSGIYRYDISKWVLGYIIGVEWEDTTVAYTDKKYPDRTQYQGKYLYTSKDATPFECMLTQTGDTMISYETKKYNTQRLLAFANWPTTDPLDYSESVTQYYMKCAKVDVEHIKSTDQFVSGQFASYHVYPYYPDYLNYDADTSQYKDENGNINTYEAYLKLLTKHHTMPVVITEFGISTGRGMAQRDENTGRNQGNMSESEQGDAIISCYEDIIDAGCRGGCIFSWQDEWFKRTWNTMNQIDLKETPYWSDYQTNEQYFGLLSFDPGTDESICYVDGDIKEWSDNDKVMTSNDNNSSVSIKYDEKFIYFLIYKKDYNSHKDNLYIPIDTTQKSGSNYCKNFDLKFERAADFLMVIKGKNDSHVYVQERYEVMRAMYGNEVYGENPYINIPDRDSPLFKTINLVLQLESKVKTSGNTSKFLMQTYETGKLTYGNANPASTDYNSLADYITQGDYTEVRIPWQLLNFNAPSKMQIHDDYYENYGIEPLNIDNMYVGIGTDVTASLQIVMNSFELKPFNTAVTYHERLKQSYFKLKDYWTNY